MKRMTSKLFDRCSLRKKSFEFNFVTCQTYVRVEITLVHLSDVIITFLLHKPHTFDILGPK